MASNIIDNKANLTTATSSDTPPGTTAINAAPSTSTSTSIHPSSLPSNPTETAKTDINPTGAVTDPTVAPSSDSSLPTKPKNDRKNLADVILEALQDEVNHEKASRKSGGSAHNESVAARMLGSHPNSATHSGIPSPPTNSVQSSAITSSSDVAKTPVGTSTPKDEASAAVENKGVDAPPTDAPETSTHNSKPHAPFQKYSPLITAAPGTHTAPPGTAMGPPPKVNKESKFHEEVGNSTLPGDKPTENQPVTLGKTKHQKVEDGEFVSSGTKDSPAKKTTGPHHHDILNKLDPRVHNHKHGLDRGGVAV